MKKSLIFKTLYLFLVLVVVAVSSVFATNAYLSARDISYGSSNVETALNDLYTLKGNDENYSTDEKVVGKWIDGKPIYRKILKNQIIPSTTADGIVSIGSPIDLSSYNIDTFLDASLILKTSGGNVLSKGQTVSCGGNDGNLYQVSSIYISTDKALYLYNNRLSWNNQPMITIILEYTKTTDNAKN